MAKNRQKRAIGSYGQAKSYKEIREGISKDKKREKKLSERNPFPLGHEGWYAWIAWAKLKLLGFRPGKEPRPKDFTKYEDRKGTNEKTKPGRIYKNPRLPKTKEP